jgi:hypothetical protein
LVCKRIFHIIQTVLLITRLEMLRANGIVPHPEPHQVEPQQHTTPPSPSPETSSGKGERSKLEVKEEVKSELETDDEDSDNMREKFFLVRFYISCSNLLTSLSLIMLG